MGRCVRIKLGVCILRIEEGWRWERDEGGGGGAGEVEVVWETEVAG